MDNSSPLLIYDGDCSFCTSSANWVSARWHGRAHAVPWQRLTDDELAAYGLGVDDARAAAWWVDPDGRTSRGHLAIARSLAAGAGWPAAAGRLLLSLPFRWVGAAVYPAVSRWRHRLPGATPACRITR